MKKVLLIANHDVVIYNFRLEFIEELLKKNYDVYIALPYGKKVSILEKKGCYFINTPMSRHGVNIFCEQKLFLQYLQILNKVKPDITFTYTVKPNIYGSIACRLKKIPCVPTITGLGNAIKNATILSKLVIMLYRFAFQNVQTVFFQNQENQNFFLEKGISVNRQKLVRGSGVNLELFKKLDYPSNSITNFVFIGRIMKEKGIDEYLEAAQYIHNKYSNVEFHICGFIDGNYFEKLKQFEKNKTIIYHGMVEDVRTILTDMHCVVLPSYHEGMSNALLEAAACAKPLLASDISGCNEIVKNNITGFLFLPRNTSSLIEKIENFLQLNWEEQKKLGLNARDLAERFFDRKIIVNTYMEEIDNESL